MLNLKQGSELVKYARKTIEQFFDGKQQELKGFNKKQGVFVTLFKYPSHELRGCIGFPYPSLPLGKAVEEAAKSAAFSDPRFLPLQREELEKIVIEISILTVPKGIKCRKENLPRNIKIGRDGLIVFCHGFSGLLLPQVPVEWKFNAEKFLEQTCIKAGLHAETWKQQECKVYKFQAQIFSEIKPKGKIIEKT